MHCSHSRLLLPRAITRGTPCVPSPSAARAVLLHSRMGFIEHSSDPAKWRSPSKAEVKRRHAGVKLGSEFARIRAQGEAEQQLVDADKFTDWNIIWRCAIVAAVLLVLLTVLMETVGPNPPPEYTPYETVHEQREGDQMKQRR